MTRLYWFIQVPRLYLHELHSVLAARGEATLMGHFQPLNVAQGPKQSNFIHKLLSPFQPLSVAQGPKQSHSIHKLLSAWDTIHFIQASENHNFWILSTFQIQLYITIADSLLNESPRLKTQNNLHLICARTYQYGQRVYYHMHQVLYSIQVEGQIQKSRKRADMIIGWPWQVVVCPRILNSIQLHN
jgi:hypothetical protein